MSSTNWHDLYSRSLKRATNNPVLTGFCGSLILSLFWVVRDFYAWKAFGTGGTPPTWLGYLRMTVFRIHRLLSSDSLRDPSPLSKEGPQYLKPGSPKPREGQRPKIMSRTMPQRQHPEPIEPAARDRLMSLMRDLQARYPELLELAPSKTEGRTADAIYGRADLPTLNPIVHKHRLLGREIAHVHAADNSLHVWLSQPDARAVMQAGWGERFPLTFIPGGWSMIYAPRTESELKEVEEIVKAAIGWITGVAV